MKEGRELYEIKVHELRFVVKKLKIHQKLHAAAALEFSETFKKYIDSVQDRSKKHKLKQIAGLAGENEKPMTKTAKRAKQAGQYRKGKTKINNQEYQEEIAPPPPPPNKKVPPEYKSLYRKVAQRLHPDKVGDDEQKALMLQEVNSAIATGNFFKILECAIEMNIELPEDTPIDIRSIDNEIESNKKKIKVLTKSVAWEWYHLSSEEEKRNLIEGYVKYLLKNR